MSLSQQAGPAGDAKAVTFYSVSELTKPIGGSPALRGARAADPKEWPASFYSVHQGGSCTSTLVGPRSLLTAAHCVPNKGTALVRLNSKNYSGICTRSDLYSASQPSPDWALCLMESDVPIVLYETVNSDPSRVQAGTILLLTGFGCTTASGTGGNDNIYRIGNSKVDRIPSGDDNDIQTVGAAALCFGDSGGGAFVFLNSSKTQRLQVSVNSRIENKNGILGNRSFLSSLSTLAAQKFLKTWSDANNASICGVTSGAVRCR